MIWKDIKGVVHMSKVEHVREAFAKTEREESKLTEAFHPHKLRGMSTFKVRHFLNNVCELEDLKYLEIGTWQGSTLCSALYGNEGEFYAIDHFVKDYNRSDDGRLIKDLLFENLNRFDLQDKVSFFDADSFKFDLSNIEHKINVYFYDGAHNDWAQRDALLYYKPVLADEFIYIVDDWRDCGEGKDTGATIGTFEAIESDFEQLDYFEAPRGDYHAGLGIFVLRGK